jgi:hypothetical protein
VLILISTDLLIRGLRSADQIFFIFDYLRDEQWDDKPDEESMKSGAYVHIHF